MTVPSATGDLRSIADLDGLPTISVVVPVLDGVRHLGACLTSVLDQDYPRIELIVMDGGSTDGTVDVIERFRDGLHHWRSRPDEGQSAAINEGMDIATGDLCNWLNADDCLLPGSLMALAAARRSSVDPVVLCGPGHSIDDRGGTIARRRLREVADPIVPNAPPLEGFVQASAFLSRSAWERVGGLDPELRYAMDIDLYLRCRRAAITFAPVPTPLAAYRVHPRTKTNAAWRASLREKRSVYTADIERAHPSRRRHHRRRVDRNLAALAVRSADPDETARERVRRLGTAVRMDPSLVAHPRRLARLGRRMTGPAA